VSLNVYPFLVVEDATGNRFARAWDAFGRSEEAQVRDVADVEKLTGQVRYDIVRVRNEYVARMTHSRDLKHALDLVKETP
jgi:hypothetical protein